MAKIFNIHNLTYDSWFQVDKDGSRDMFPGSSLAEERVERIIPSADRLVAGHLTIWLDPVFKAVQLPAGIAYLDPGLSDMDGYTFTLKTEKMRFKNKLKFTLTVTVKPV